MRRLLIFLGAAVAVLLVAEGLARVLAPAMAEPEEWPDAATAVKVAQMDALDCADLVFVGNSMARDAFDPSQWSDVGAYNAALDAATPEQLARWVPNEVVPRLDPSTVVWASTWRRRSAKACASISVVSGSSTMNSSPPQRASRSPVRSSLRIT